MTTNINRLPKSTVELTVSLPWEEVKPVWEKHLDEATKNVEVPGFRRGKAPRGKAEEAVDKSKLLEKVVSEIVPKAYQEVVKEHNLQPIAQPRVQLNKVAYDNDWEIKLSVAEKPEVKLGDYKDKIKGKLARDKIWLPGKKDGQESTQGQNQQKTQKLKRIIEILMKEVAVEVSELLIEDEAGRSLAKLLDDIKTLGLTLEQYLVSTQKTAEGLRTQYTKAAADQLKLSFILQEIAEAEKITVSNEELQKVIEETARSQVKQEKKLEEKEDAAATESQKISGRNFEGIKKALEAQSYTLASIMRRQKTLDYLMNL